MNQKITKFLAVLLFAGVSLLWYSGAFVKVDVHDADIGPYNFIYFKRVGPLNQELEKESQQIMKEMNTIFTKSVTASIYYDNPKTLIDPNTARMAMGFLVDNSEKEKIEQFLSTYPKYSQTILSETDSGQFVFQLTTPLSGMLIIQKIYPVLYKFINVHCQPFNAIFEIYQFNEGTKKVIFNIPYSKEYYLF